MTPEPPEAVNRHKIDEAQIIYSYLKSNSGSYILLPQELLHPEHQSSLRGAVRELLENYFGL